MGSIISKLADEIKLHGSYEAYCAWRDMKDPEANFILSNGIPISRPFLPPPPKLHIENGIPYFPDPEVVNTGDQRLDGS